MPAAALPPQPEPRYLRRPIANSGHRSRFAWQGPGLPHARASSTSDHARPHSTGLATWPTRRARSGVSQYRRGPVARCPARRIRPCCAL